MTDSLPTISETITEIRAALRDYIEATYHIGHPDLIDQRRRILEQEGVLFRAPYIESTRRYVAERSFASLDIPAAAKSLLTSLTRADGEQAALLFDPPYTHQATALEATTRDGMSLVVTTGTGSGKTESFLLPILAKLAQEAATSPASFAAPAMRALLLYPMNALVNDQLGRLRLLFGDPRVTTRFTAWAGRPARFARYTSRTLYPGVRSSKKDSLRLRSIERFYIQLLQQAEDVASPNRDGAQALIDNLRARGKWPAKPDLQKWFGESRQHWQKGGEFVRAVLLPEDPELLTRHEVLSAPPDLLITNYSMLEYTLMRPLERPIFDATREWLRNNPAERLLLVVDEAHLYRGASGAEVALLLRRLRSRLAVAADRLQVVCTSASFADTDYAREFAAQLVGKLPSDFQTVVGTLALRPEEAAGTDADAVALAHVPLDVYYQAQTDATRLHALRSFLDYRGYKGAEACGPALYDALHAFPPMSRLVNLTMLEAAPLEELSARIFPDSAADVADRALTNLVALGSAARRSEGEPGLLPCRIHAFFRGLPGLWACLDTTCPDSSAAGESSPVGALFSQPRAACTCGARVFELYTCRNCGTTYARAYTDDLEEPKFLWHEPGRNFASAAGVVPELEPLDLLLEEPSRPTEPADIDLITGRLNPLAVEARVRRVYLPLTRTADIADTDADGNGKPTGEFKPCAVCGDTAGYGRSAVQDHQTKGDQPFQALVTRQIEVQPPGAQPYSDFAPLRGRKVLAFSDSRQTAARLAPNLQTYSMQDVLRPIILRGWRELDQIPLLSPSFSLDGIYLAVLVGAHLLSVRLRPELRGGESMHAAHEVARAVDQGALADPAEFFQLYAAAQEPPPHSLLRGIAKTITDRYFGLTSLGLASVRERANLREPLLVTLPAIPGVAETDEARLALVRLWLAQWTRPTVGVWFKDTPTELWQAKGGVHAHVGKFQVLERWIEDKVAKKQFEKDWQPALLATFCEQKAPRKYRIRAGNLALDLGGVWGYCQQCRTTQRPFPGSSKCIHCGNDRVATIDPDTDPVFAARKGYYRNSSMGALADPPVKPLGIIAAEHTAQLNAAQSDEVFSKAEQHELLFQDVDLGIPIWGEREQTAIDVLSCTTTMEVGIDIGSLSGVALRNMPPSRASYQQRSGRAGRRGNAVATVVAFGSVDSHDEHYFREPGAMIRGAVDDPVLTLDNDEIARRHLTAYLFQRYHQARLPKIEPSDQPQLFEVLGTVDGFLGDESPLNREDFESWLRENRAELSTDAADWLPSEISAPARRRLLDGLVAGTLTLIDRALAEDADTRREDRAPRSRDEAEQGTDEGDVAEGAAEEGQERRDPRRTVHKLLDRLLYKGVLPSYAFPTDVVSFYVFDRDRSTRFRPEYKYAPSQGLPVALTQYAPGKEIWIDGKLWTSGALYSEMPDDLYRSWQERQLYFECNVCHYARHWPYGPASRKETRDCPACGSDGTFGPAKNWMRPPGFAHPLNEDEGTSLDDQPARSYATRAKLVAPGPDDGSGWEQITPRIRQHTEREHLLVTNTGPRREGYTYCTICGLIQPNARPSTGRSQPVVAIELVRRSVKTSAGVRYPRIRRGRLLSSTATMSR